MTENTNLEVLTRDVFLKHGFEDYGHGFKKDNVFIYSPGSPSSDYGFGVKGIGLIRSIKYLHQLKNLWFALFETHLTTIS